MKTYSTSLILGDRIMAPPGMSKSSSADLRICYFTWQKGTLQMWLRIWGWGDCPGVSGWAQSHHQGPQEREARGSASEKRQCEQGSRVSEGDETTLCCWLWRWRKGPWAKKCKWPLETGTGKETCSPREPPEGSSPAATLTSAQSLCLEENTQQCQLTSLAYWLPAGPQWPYLPCHCDYTFPTNLRS